MGVFNFGGGRMRLVDDDAGGFIIGLKVEQAAKHEIGVIVKVEPMGATVIFDDGRQSHGQRFDSLSPFTRIAKLHEQEIVSDLKVEQLLQLAENRRAQERIDREAAARRHTEDVERCTAQYEAEYPDRITTGSRHARGAKNIKRELAKAFPGMKFKVTSRSYSGGDSIDVYWTDGPNGDEVQPYTSKYQEGSFDGMRDMYVSNRDAASEALHVVLGSSKYVFCHRSFSGLTRKAVESLVRKEHEIEPTASGYATMLKSGEYLDRYIQRLLHATSIPVNGILVGVCYDHGDLVLLFSVPALRTAGQLKSTKEAEV